MYFGTYEVVKEMAGGNVDEGHHPLAAGKCSNSNFIDAGKNTDILQAASGAAATIASDALMNPSMVSHLRWTDPFDFFDTWK